MKLSRIAFLSVATAMLTCPLPAQTEAGNPQEVQEILNVARQRFPEPSMISDPAIAKTDLTTLLNRLIGSALLTTPSITNTQPKPITTTLLPNQVFYVRMASFKAARGWDALEGEIRGAVNKGALGVVLDVRDFESSNDFAAAAEAASLFCPQGSVLFTVLGMQTKQKLYSVARPTKPLGAPLIVLINRRSVGAAEAFAACLRTSGKGILLGRSTAGQAAVYTDVRLSTGRYLRLATEQVVLGDGTKLFGQAIQPDIPLFVEDGNEHEALLRIQQGQAVEVIRELPTRRRMSEASLVRDENPEIDEAAREQKESKDKANGKGTGPLIQDAALIRAGDVLRGLRLVNLTKPPGADNPTATGTVPKS